MCQFCIDLQELDNNYIYNDNYLKDAQDFNIKYKETLKTNTNYMQKFFAVRIRIRVHIKIWVRVLVYTKILQGIFFVRM